MKTRIFFCLAYLLVLTAQAASYGSVRFQYSDLYVYERDGSVTVGVQGIGGSLNAFASVAADVPQTTATFNVDYTTNSVFKWPGGNGYGIAVVTNLDNATRYFTIPIVDNSNDNGEKVIFLEFYGTSRTRVSPTNCYIHILDDDNRVKLTGITNLVQEWGSIADAFTITREGNLSAALRINFTKSGTAVYGTHYSLSGSGVAADYVDIPANTSTATIQVTPVNNSLADGDRIVTLALAGGYYFTNATNFSSSLLIRDDEISVSVKPTDATASEDGESGQFTVSRSTDVGGPLKVHFSISGTAGNGVDYAYLSNSVVIPAGESFTTLTVAPIYDASVEGSETVILTLTTNVGYLLSSETNATVTVADFDDSTRQPPQLGGVLAPDARYGRFTRGSGTSPAYHSFVVPIDFQQGVPLGDNTGRSSNLFSGINWSTNYQHYNYTNAGGPIVFTNPIVAFGNRVGGSSLYYGQKYTFGIYAGEPKPAYTNSSVFTNALRIKVYEQSGFTLVTNLHIPIPDPSNPDLWHAFLTNGYALATNFFGLRTTLSFNQRQNAWGASLPEPNYNATYHLSHQATAGDTNYVYLVELAGGTDEGWMVKDANGDRAWSPLYTVEFEERPPWRTLLLTTPQFFRQPTPPGLIGRSAEELLTINPVVTNTVSLPEAPNTYTNLDHSPELRRHPALDQLVADLGRDPLLIANYVLNEIELTDAIDYNDNGVMSETSVNLGGVNRGALGTLLEGQGSPTEQCALLVYLLRQAGVPAVYAFPPPNGVQIADARLSRLLRTQIRGAVDDLGNPYTSNVLIPVNYPWVSAYIGTNWVHVFPWLKDTVLEEGNELYSVMPEPYDNAFKLAKAYAYGDTNLLSMSPEDDSPLLIFPRFVDKMLKEYAPQWSLDQLGSKAWNRRHNHIRWTDFPTPTVVTNTQVAVESLGSSSITNVSPALTNIFNTVSVEVKSLNDANKTVYSGDLRLAELHNRRLVAWHTKVSSTSHTLTLSLAAFRTNVTDMKAFASVVLTNAADTNALVNLTTNTTLGSSDDTLQLTVIHKRHRSLPGGFTQPAYWTPYLGFQSTLAVTNIRYLNKGDLAAICTDVGRVSRKMLEQHAVEIWNMEKAGVAGSTDQYQGSVAALMGMSYFEKTSRFNAMAARLHKAQPISFFSSGVAMLRAARDASGQLPDGNITLVQPVLDMFFQEVATIGNATLHLDSGDDGYGPNDRVFELFIAGGSALEHTVLNRFYQQSDSVSTIRLLQLAQTTNGIVYLSRSNYVSMGETVFPAGSTNKLKDADPAIWTAVVNAFNASYVSNQAQVFITPGKISNATKTYNGVGALVIRPGSYGAYIGTGLNGGYSPPLPDSTLTSANLPNVNLRLDNDNNVVMDSRAPVENNIAATTEYSTAEQPAYASQLNGSTIIADPLDLSLTIGGDQLNLVSGDPSVLMTQVLNTGATDVGTKQDGGLIMSWLADPVNAVSGEFYLDAVDLRLTGPMPLEVRRNYSSHNVFDNEFGYGWKLSYLPFLTVSVDTTNLFVYAAESDGSVIAYRRQTNAVGVYTNIWQPLPVDNPRLQNAAGSIGNLYQAQIVKTTNSGTITYSVYPPDGGLREYPVRSYPLSAGVQRTRPYLEHWQDNRGNFFRFYYGEDSTLPDYGQMIRAESSSGNFLGFHYDIYGHITEAYTGDGRRMAYEYDDFGDLVKVTHPDASEINYGYEHQAMATNNTRQIYSTHLMIREEKPDGRVLQNDYDAHRRVINQYATVGTDLRPIRNASFAYANDYTFTGSLTNLTTGYTIVTDYLTNTMRYDYSNGLMTVMVDAVGRTNRQEWYGDSETNAPAYPRSLKRTVDARGLITDFQYDVVGNVTNVTRTGNLTGDGGAETATTLFTYNANRLPVLMVDAIGNKTVYTYTNPISPYLRSSEERYSTNDTLISAAVNDFYSVTNDPVTGNFAGSYGLLRSVVKAHGSADAATNLFGHNAYGLVTNTVRFSGTTDPNVENWLLYNLRGELVESVDAAGRRQYMTYTPRGQMESKEVFSETGELLSRSYSYYNQNGELTWTDGPRFDPEDYVWRNYDGAGRVTQEVRWRTQAKADGSGVEAPAGDALYATSFMEYNPNGDLVKHIDPRGNYTRMAYDAMGQLLVRSSHEGTNATALAVESFGYEPGGLVAFHTNVLNGVTQKLYTSEGKPLYQSGPDGSTNGWRYYLDGRPKRAYQSNGAYWETAYNDAARQITKVFYSAGGTPLATNLTAFDRRGNATISLDAAGFGSTNRFDGLDRVKSWVGPKIAQAVLAGAPAPPGGTALAVQQGYTNYFDAAGVVLTNVNALGEKTITYTDALGRNTRTEVRTSANVLVRETSTAYALNHHSVTVTNGSGANAIISTGFTDNAGRNVLSLGYPAADVVHFTRSEYDMAGNLAFTGTYSKTNSTLTQFTSASFAYDGLNRLSEKTDRDGATTTYSYDAAGHVVQQIVPGSLQWLALYNSAGQMFTNWNASGGGAVVRANGYTYYGSGHAWAGLTATHTDARGVVMTSLYDDYLRPTTNSYTGSLDEQNLSTIWKYDVRGLVTNIVEKFASTTTGPTVTLNRSYNAYGEIVREDAGFGTNGLSSAHNYDSAGRRQSLDVGQFGYNFVWRADGALTNVNTERGKTFYGYNTAGWLTNRIAESLNAFRNTKISTRDGMGRPLSVETKVGVTTVLTETLAYTGDGLIAAHTVDRAALLDERQYAYASQSRRLVSERLDIDGSTAWTNTFTFDAGAAQGAGVLTRINQPGGADWSAHMDDHLRVDRETNNVVRRLAYGRVNMQPNFGFATIGIKLNDRSVPFLSLGNSDTNWPTRWQAQIELTPGTHTLTATAVHPSNLYTNSASTTFTNAAVDQTTLSYYSEGQLTGRVWKNGAGATNRIQTFQWDAKGRLYRFTERDVNGDGHDWSAVYDSFDRRWQTMTVPTIGNTALTNQLKTFTQAYDPHGEFLEVGVYVDGRWSWKIHGPDANGQYGSLNGLGGWDAVVTGPDAFYPLLPDARGNILGAVSAENSSLLWNDARITGYGSIAGRRPLSLGEGVSLWEAGAWRGKYPELSGLYNLGARYYDPVAGRFLSPDPMGHDSDPSLYSFANGDPINYFDPDGRYARDFLNNNPAGVFLAGSAQDVYGMGSRFVNGVVEAGAIGSDMVGQTTASWFGYGADYQGYSQLYQNIYHDPSMGPTATSIMIGTGEAVINTGSLGLYGMGQSFGEGFATGDFTKAQDSSLGALFMSGYAKSVQGTGVNPWTGAKYLSASDPVPMYFESIQAYQKAWAEMAVHERANALQAALGSGQQGRVTMAAGAYLDANSVPQIAIASSEPGAYLRPAVRNSVYANETIVGGIGHAEMKLLNSGLNPFTVAAGRPVCPNCAVNLISGNVTVASPLKVPPKARP